MQTKKLEITDSRSMKNGICFYSQRYKNFMAVSTVDDDGNIKTVWTTEKLYEKRKGKRVKELEKRDFFKFCISLLPIEIIWLALLCWGMTFESPFFAIRIFLLGFSLQFILALLINSLIERKYDTHKFHAAEHMALNAYEKLNRVPSLEEIRKYSRFYDSCDSNLILFAILESFIVFICSFIPDLFLTLVGIFFCTFIIFILSLLHCMNFLQFFNTAVPTDKELSVAIQGMNMWLEHEKDTDKAS